MARVITAGRTLEGRSRLLLVAGGVFAVIAAALVFAAVRGRDEGGGASAPAVSVVVAARDIPANSLLDPRLLELRSVPESLALEGAYTAVEALAGLATRYPLAKGQQITPLATGAGVTGNQQDLSLAVPPGRRAVGVEVREMTGVGGLLLPGNRVDVLGVLSDQSTGAPKATTLLQNIEVLAVGQEAQRPAVQPQDTDDAQAGTPLDAERQPDARTITLAVLPEEALLLALAQQHGNVWLALRPLGEDTVLPPDERTLPYAAGGE